MGEWLLILVVVMASKDSAPPNVSIATGRASTLSECQARGEDFRAHRRATEVARGYTCTAQGEEVKS